MDPEDQKQFCQPPAAKPVVTFIKRLKARPIVVFIKRVKAAIDLIPYCGVWQRKILARLDQWICLLTCDGGSYGNLVRVADTLTLLRAPERRARKTIITNQGAAKFRIYENGGLVRVLYPGDTWESPTSGQMQITGQCDPGGSAYAGVTTFLRCACGVSDYYGYSGSDPIGGDLL